MKIKVTEDSIVLYDFKNAAEAIKAFTEASEWFDLVPETKVAETPPGEFHDNGEPRKRMKVYKTTIDQLTTIDLAGGATNPVLFARDSGLSEVRARGRLRRLEDIGYVIYRDGRFHISETGRKILNGDRG